MSDRDEEKQGIKVTDKRRFAIDDSGEVVSADATEGEQAPPADPPPDPPESQPDAPEADAPEEEAAQGEPKRPSLRDRVKAKLSGKSAEEANQEFEAAGETGGAKLPQIDFSAFVMSLASSVMIHFGDVEDPISGAKSQNLPAAKQTIDILGMMQEKTKGNLTQPEDKLLEAFLYDLRMRYVSLTKK